MERLCVSLIRKKGETIQRATLLEPLNTMPVDSRLPIRFDLDTAAPCPAAAAAAAKRH